MAGYSKGRCYTLAPHRSQSTQALRTAHCTLHCIGLTTHQCRALVMIRATEVIGDPQTELEEKTKRYSENPKKQQLQCSRRTSYDNTLRRVCRLPHENEAYQATTLHLFWRMSRSGIPARIHLERCMFTYFVLSSAARYKGPLADVVRQFHFLFSAARFGSQPCFFLRLWAASRMGWEVSRISRILFGVPSFPLHADVASCILLDQSPASTITIRQKFFRESCCRRPIWAPLFGMIVRTYGDDGGKTYPQTRAFHKIAALRSKTIHRVPLRKFSRFL
jgi:hypothetical protein